MILEIINWNHKHILFSAPYICDTHVFGSLITSIFDFCLVICVTNMEQCVEMFNSCLPKLSNYNGASIVGVQSRRKNLPSRLLCERFKLSRSPSAAKASMAILVRPLFDRSSVLIIGVWVNDLLGRKLIEFPDKSRCCVSIGNYIK